MRLFNRAISSLAYVAALPFLLIAGLALPAGAQETRQPQPYQMHLQDPVSPVGVRIGEFHDYLLWIIFAIAIFVLLLLIYVCLKHPRSRHDPKSHRQPVVLVL